ADPEREPLAAILDDLQRADVLIVFNHPLWDLAGIGQPSHLQRLCEFLDAYGPYLHALELNGYRSWRENGGVRALSAGRAMPLISGGDRHARQPNAVLNLTRAETFAAFAAEIRDGLSHVVVMPEYRRHIAVRILRSAADVVAPHRTLPAERRRWTDRVSCDWEGCVRPLSYHWPNGGPLWVRSSIALFQVATSPPALSVWGTALGGFDGPINSIPALK